MVHFFSWPIESFFRPKHDLQPGTNGIAPSVFHSTLRTLTLLSSCLPASQLPSSPYRSWLSSAVRLSVRRLLALHVRNTGSWDRYSRYNVAKASDTADENAYTYLPRLTLSAFERLRFVMSSALPLSFAVDLLSFSACCGPLCDS